MRRLLSKLPVKSKLILFALSSAILLVIFLYLQNWPTLTRGGSIHRLERQYLSTYSCEVVAQGTITPPYHERVDNRATNWFVTEDAEGRYGVAVLERLLGVLWRPAKYLNYFVPDRYRGSDQALQSVSVSFDSGISPDQSTFVYYSAFLIFSDDEAITRVTVTEAALPLEEQHDPGAYLDAHGVSIDCTPVARGIWSGELQFPRAADSPSGASSAPWTTLRGYDTEGNLLYEYLPKPREKE